MACSNAACVRYGFTLANDLRWKKLFLTTALTCCWNLNALSKITPRFLTEGLISEVKEPRVEVSEADRASPNTMGESEFANSLTAPSVAY